MENTLNSQKKRENIIIVDRKITFHFSDAQKLDNTQRGGGGEVTLLVST